MRRVDITRFRFGFHRVTVHHGHLLPRSARMVSIFEAPIADFRHRHWVRSTWSHHQNFIIVLSSSLEHHVFGAGIMRDIVTGDLRCRFAPKYLHRAATPERRERMPEPVFHAITGCQSRTAG